MKYKKEDRVSLKIYCDNTDTYNSEPLWEYIVNFAKELGVVGATVYKAVAGVGSSKELHRFDLLNLSTTLPLIVEIIDIDKNINSLLDKLDIKDRELLIIEENCKVIIKVED